MGLLSFAACMLSLRQDPYLAFYMMPFRIFEFSIGCIALLLNQRPRPLISMLCGALGTAILIASCFIFDGNSPRPGIRALPERGNCPFYLWPGARERGTRCCLSHLCVGWGASPTRSTCALAPHCLLSVLVVGAADFHGIVRSLAASLFFGALLYLTVERFYRISAEPKAAWTFGWEAHITWNGTGAHSGSASGRIFAIFLLVPALRLFSSAIIANVGFPDRMKRDRFRSTRVNCPLPAIFARPPLADVVSERRRRHELYIC